jgi:exonuclease VII large subunit
VVITQCEPVGGQQWTDGFEYYSDDGRYYQSQREDSQDLVSFVGLLPVNRPAETESTTAVAGGVSEDPGRIIYNLEQRLEAAKERNSKALNQLAERDKAINEKTAEIERLRAELERTQAWRTAATDAHLQSETLRIEQQTEIERLRAEWRTEFTAAQQLRSEVAQLEQLLDDAREELQQLQADSTAMDHHCMGQKAAFLAVIKTLAGVRA